MDLTFAANYKYKEGYLPTKRCRRLRYREATDKTEIIIPKLKSEDTPVAFVTIEGGQSKEYRLYRKKLWVPVLGSEKNRDANGFWPIKDMIKEITNYNSGYFLTNKKESEKAVKDHASQYIIVDGIVYEEVGEPRYEIDTFGLGHNHGGTGMFIENYYNPNVSKNCYFNALERNKAIAYGRKVAAARGDTESIDEIGTDCEIKVLISEAVHCNPQKEHGKGDQFTNRMEQLIEASSNRNEAALLVMCESIAEINKL